MRFFLLDGSIFSFWLRPFPKIIVEELKEGDLAICARQFVQNGVGTHIPYSTKGGLVKVVVLLRGSTIETLLSKELPDS